MQESMTDVLNLNILTTLQPKTNEVFNHEMETYYIPA